MKISELTTDQALDVLCEITPAVEDIISDEELLAEVRKKIVRTKETTKAEILRFALEKITKIIPILLKKKRESVYTIVAALNVSDVETVKQQNAIKTMAQIREAFNDKDLVDFVRSCLKTEKSAS